MKKVPALVAFSVLLLCPRMPAQANGAFPDSMGILLPVDRPNWIIATTNFGLLVSEDAGATWGWVCEQAIGLNTFLYQQGAPPNDLVLGVSLNGVTHSGDFGCAWNRSGGEISTYIVYDVSPHVVAPLRAYALARHDTSQTVTAHQSQDGARTFGPAFLSSSENQFFTGIENARSRPETLYVTISLEVPVRPYVARSYDSGATWQPLFDPGPDFNRWRIDLLGVDPVNERKVYLRMMNLATVKLSASTTTIRREGTGRCGSSWNLG